ncbi:MAG: hypothetical protein AB7V77_01340 [Candidatus Woesearchaeota archaeon]
MQKNLLKLVLILLITFTFTVVLAPQINSLSCSITTNTTCTDQILLYLKNDTAGYNNAHVALANYSSDYPYVLCCDADAQQKQVNSSCDALDSEIFLSLSTPTNSHVQNNTIGNYTYNSCIAVPKYELEVNYRDSCISGETCLVSISNYTNAHVAECSYYTTQVCTNITFSNNLPEVTQIELTPTSANTTTDLNCYFTIEDVDVGDVLKANYSWYKNNIIQPSLSGQKAVTNGTQTYVTLGSTNTTHFENWTCAVTPYDSYQYGNINYSNNATITNTAPSIPVRIAPTDGDNSLTDRMVNFSWIESTDIDNDVITYVINLTNENKPGFYENTTNTSYIDLVELLTIDECGNKPYYWKIQACDEYNECSDWTTLWNFSILSVLWVELTNDQIDFGNVEPNQIYDTTGEEFNPFEFENYGNVKADLFNITGDDLWATVPLGNNATTENDYVQAKANYNTSLEPYNILETKTNWFNVTNGYYLEDLVREFDYHEDSNKSLMDLRIKVPDIETPGQKSTTLTFYWMKS